MPSGKYKRSEEQIRIFIERNKGNTYRLGGHHTEEAKRKIGEAHKGKKGKIGYWSGKHFSEKHRENISKALIAHYSQSGKSSSPRGKEHCNWKGGISFEPYPIMFNKELKELIRQRDNYQCQLCGMPECENIYKLDVHHIDYYKNNCLPSNLISLCKKCNAIVNFNRIQWKKYFKKKLHDKGVRIDVYN
jgi:5-methylcytosine-specific restriction endonuclease McrA